MFCPAYANSIFLFSALTTSVTSPSGVGITTQTNDSGGVGAATLSDLLTTPFPPYEFNLPVTAEVNGLAYFLGNQIKSKMSTVSVSRVVQVPNSTNTQLETWSSRSQSSILYTAEWNDQITVTSATLPIGSTTTLSFTMFSHFYSDSRGYRSIGPFNFFSSASGLGNAVFSRNGRTIGNIQLEGFTVEYPGEVLSLSTRTLQALVGDQLDVQYIMSAGGGSSCGVTLPDRFTQGVCAGYNSIIAENSAGLVIEGESGISIASAAGVDYSIKPSYLSAGSAVPEVSSGMLIGVGIFVFGMGRVLRLTSWVK